MPKSCLMSFILVNLKKHSTYKLKTQVLSKRLRLEDVDEHLCLTKNLTDQSVYIISGQNSDLNNSARFYQRRLFLSYFMNWGMTGALKSFL